MSRLLFLALFASLLLGALGQQTCRREQDCDCVSLGREYVTCRNQTCVCWQERGFLGSATEADKCRCPAPRSVYQVRQRGQGNVDDSYCVDIPVAAQQVAAEERCLALENITKTLYQLVIYPRNLQILSNQIDLHAFVAVDTHSRFTPVGEFTGLEGFIEYYYGLGSTEAGFVQDVKFRTLACDKNVVHFRIDLLFNQTGSPVGPTVRVFNFTHVGYFVFNERNLIEVADITFTNMGATADTPADALVVLPPNPDPIPARMAFILGLCFQAIPTFCTGANQQYADGNECVAFMSSIPYGSFDRANSNTVTCRLVHSGLIFLRPDIHCPHVGPTGGGKCVDFLPASYYQSAVETGLNALVPQN